MIELDDIHKAFNQGQPNEYWALSGIHLKVEAHQVTALSGPSGSGKTTLLTLLGCLSRPTRGRVRLRGEDVAGFHGAAVEVDGARAALRRVASDVGARQPEVHAQEVDQQRHAGIGFQIGKLPRPDPGGEHDPAQIRRHREGHEARIGSVPALRGQRGKSLFGKKRFHARPG